MQFLLIWWNRWKKQYALPVYDRDNIYLIDDERLVFTIDDQLFF